MPGRDYEIFLFKLDFCPAPAHINRFGLSVTFNVSNYITFLLILLFLLPIEIFWNTNSKLVVLR
ncbi:hypothetical protein [Staphylococcus marylandisciuri]|uniref:hypothetical protein n=1 Tax=Staphylococcus marylandisciuri TaxID=2981529 RepID=UPI0021D0C4B7|nr:hypothetical protein [Staphylococcus marylandisciuri]